MPSMSPVSLINVSSHKINASVYTIVVGLRLLDLRAECTDFPTQVTRGVHRGLLEGAGSGDADDFVMQNANQSESRGSNITSRAQVESIA